MASRVVGETGLSKQNLRLGYAMMFESAVVAVICYCCVKVCHGCCCCAWARPCDCCYYRWKDRFALGIFWEKPMCKTAVALLLAPRGSVLAFDAYSSATPKVESVLQCPKVS